MTHSTRIFISLLALLLLASPGTAGPSSDTESIATQQRQALALATDGKGFGPQSPRDIDKPQGDNNIHFAPAPAYQNMHLCNIHFHKNAEHKGGEFTQYVGPGDGNGNQSGYRYLGQLNDAESAEYTQSVCAGEYSELRTGDTIEVHYVHTTAPVSPGPTLGACFSTALKNPQLRVEAQVYVLVNSRKALQFDRLAQVPAGFPQAPLHLPTRAGKPVEYAGSTTGPGYNAQGSPYEVTWRVFPKVLKVDIASVGRWCESNIFDEHHPHGVRNLVTNRKLLAPIY